MHRVRVGLTGLAAVLIVIGLASAIIGGVDRGSSVSAIGASNSSVVANMTDGGNQTIELNPAGSAADLGVAPGAVPAETVANSAPK